MITLSLSGKSVQAQSHGQFDALLVAEAGVDRAIWEFNYNSSSKFSGWSNVSCPAGVIGTCKQSPPGLIALINGEVTVLVQGIEGSSPNTPKVTSTGTAKRNGVATVTTTVEAVLQNHYTPAPLPTAIHAHGDVNMKLSAKTDSYNSSTGVVCNPGGTPACHGDVEMNTGNLITDGTTTVNGTVTTNSTVIYGVPTLPVDPSTTSGCTELGNYYVASTTILAAGTYCADSLSIADNKGLEFSGPVTLYVRGAYNTAGGRLKLDGGGVVRTGTLTISGSAAYIHTGVKVDFYVVGGVDIGGTADINAVPPSGGGSYPVPGNFVMHVVQNPADSIVDTVHLSGTGTEPYMVIDAPGLPVHLEQNLSFRGAVIGDTVTLDGNPSSIRYDEQLNSVSVINKLTSVSIKSLSRLSY